MRRLPLLGLFQRRPTLRLIVGRNTLRADAFDGASTLWAGETRYSSPTDVADAIARLATEPPRACRRLTVRFERPPLQVRTLKGLPPVARRHLVALVEQQAGRFFHRNGPALVTDAVWIERGGARIARAVAVEETLAEAIATGARSAGLWLDTMEPEAELAALTLLPPSERASREREAWHRTRRLAITAGVVWISAAALFLGRLDREKRTMDNELAELAGSLAATLVARHELRDAEAALTAVAHADEERGLSLAVLVAVTAALPDSSVLTSFVWRADGTGTLAGAAQRASVAIAQLDRVQILDGVSLEGSIVREAMGARDWERFTVRFSTARKYLKRGEL